MPLKKENSRLPIVLSFVFPFFIACLALFVGGLWPFGDGMILAHDEWHQYYPFFVDMRQKLLSGSSLTYTWSVGMGTGYLSLYAYYLSSPLYLLSVLVPTSLLREYFALMTILKIALSGGFFGIFLRITYRRNDFAIPFFSMLYAFCSWMGGYYWNIMWLDVFAMLPLLIAGTVCLLREGRFRLYVCALALSLWCNYYIAYFCCIFVLLSFIVYCICHPKGFWRRFLRIGLCTLLGVGLAAAVLVPTMFAMQNTASAAGKEIDLLSLNIAKTPEGADTSTIWGKLLTVTLPGLLDGGGQILSNLLSGAEITKMDGLPNVCCGFSTVLLAVWYLCCRRIPLREKLLNLGLLLFMLLGFLFRILDYAWHGFHFTNMLPYRFSFLFSFVLICMAYRAYQLMDGFKPWHLIILWAVGLLLIANACLQDEPRLRSILLSGLVLAGMTVALLLLHSKNRQRWGACLLCLILACDATVTYALGVYKVGTTTRSAYPKEGESVQTLLDSLNDDELLFRMETDNTNTLNEGALLGYNGVSIFTSSANVNFARFSKALGLSAWPTSNRFSYFEGSPLTNTFCSVKYILNRTDAHRDTLFTTQVDAAGKVRLLRCDSYIGMGFMTDSTLSDFVARNDVYDPTAEQSQIFRMATGLEGDLYTKIDFVSVSAPDGCTLKGSGTTGTQFSYSTENATEKKDMTVYYTIPEDGLYCMTAKYPSGNKDSTMDILCNGEKLFERNTKVRSLFSLGVLKAGDKIGFRYTMDSGKTGTFSTKLVKFNAELYQQGLKLLQDETWQISEFDDTYLSGTITARQDGLFYTSIPYEPGWTAYVDGEAVELAETYDPSAESVKLTDAVICFPVSAGTHTITLEYHAPGLALGLGISGVSLVLFAALLLLRRKDATLFPAAQPDADTTLPPKEIPLTEDEAAPESNPAEE